MFKVTIWPIADADTDFLFLMLFIHPFVPGTQINHHYQKYLNCFQVIHHSILEKAQVGSCKFMKEVNISRYRCSTNKLMHP